MSKWWVITGAQWYSMRKIDRVDIRLNDQNGNTQVITVDTNGLINKIGPLIEAAKDAEPMPDLTAEYAATCRSNQYWHTLVDGSDGEQYLVKWDILTDQERERQESTYGWHCECKAFKFRKKTAPHGYCKHIRRVMNDRCGWNAHLDPGIKATPDSKCPGCDEFVAFIPVGV